MIDQQVQIKSDCCHGYSWTLSCAFIVERAYADAIVGLQSFNSYISDELLNTAKCALECKLTCRISGVNVDL